MMLSHFIKRISKGITDNFKNITSTKFYFTTGITGAGMRYYAIYLNLQKSKH